MSLARNARRSAWACLTAIALTGAGCAAQQSSAPQATASNDVNEVLPPGTVLNVGQGTYIVPALPASSGDTGYALTGRGTPGESAPFDGRWISGTNGWVYIRQRHEQSG